MIVVFDDAIFAQADLDDSLLVSLFGEGAQGRFKVRLRPAFRAGADRAFNRWVERQSERIQEQARFVLERGLREVEYVLPDGRSELTVIIESRKDAQWPASSKDLPIRLPPTSAAKDLLTRPLRALLENGRTDWGFLCKSAPMGWRERFQQAIEKRWLEPEHAGGLPEMRKIVSEPIARDPSRRLRTWALLDSEALRRGEPSDASKETGKACESCGVPYHRLERRAVENYLPQWILLDWAARSKDRQLRQQRQNAVDALFRRPVEERHHANLKELLAGDPAEIWRGDDYAVSEGDLRADGSEPERVRLFQSLFARM